jgi:hypothetical protein
VAAIDRRNAMQDKKDHALPQAVRVDLRYDPADVKIIHWYARAHDVERGGRYDVRLRPRLNIWTHTWAIPCCRVESTLMFSLAFSGKTASLQAVLMQPGYDWETFLDELARLETAALGNVVHGKLRAKPTM